MKSHKTYGLVGRSLAHSFSKIYFSEKFDNQGISASYLNFELKYIHDIQTLLKRTDISGLNVTIPFKEAVMHYLDENSPEAKEVGAVNTIQFKDGKTIGHNTDVFGFKQMIKPFFQPQHERAIILGTGGASKAVAFALRQLGCEPIFISRTPSTTDQYAYEDVNEQMLMSCMMLVNTTPVGMYPREEDVVKFPFQYLTPKHLVVDLIYNPSETRLLERSRQQGAVVINGKTMLEQQAEKSWEIWNE